jgi:hypothetical protein
MPFPQRWEQDHYGKNLLTLHHRPRSSQRNSLHTLHHAPRRRDRQRCIVNYWGPGISAPAEELEIYFKVNAVGVLLLSKLSPLSSKNIPPPLSSLRYPPASLQSPI